VESAGVDRRSIGRSKRKEKLIAGGGARRPSFVHLNIEM